MDLNLSISLTDYAQKVIAFFAIVNPFSTIPVFLGLTTTYTDKERWRLAMKTATSTFVILAVVYVIGQGILWFFSISVASFRIAGGLLIMTVAFSMLQAKQSSTKQTEEEADEAHSKESIAIVPLSLPLMAGPGSISMVIIASGNTQTLGDDIAMTIAIAVVALSIWIILGAGTYIAKALGQTGMNVATRIMGLILAAIAVEFIINGLLEKFPGWAS